jgi:hypothetical protein
MKKLHVFVLVLISASLLRAITPTAFATNAICTNAVPVDEQFVNDLVEKNSAITNFFGVAEMAAPNLGNTLIKVWSGMNGRLFKATSLADGQEEFSYYYDGRYFWFEHGNLLIKVPTETNPLQLIVNSGLPQGQYWSCGTDSVIGHTCAVVRVKLSSVNTAAIQSIVPSFNDSLAYGSETIMWIGVDDGFVYKVEAYDANGTLTGRLMYLAVDFANSDIDGSIFVPNADGKNVVPMSISEFFSKGGKDAVVGEMLKQAPSN